MPGTNLIVPVVLWGKHAPTHCISSVYLSRDQKTLVTGCYDGQICIWHVNPDSLKMTPRCLLVGHTAPVTCLSRASIIQDNNYIVSSSEAGEMCTWDLVDGKCRESVKLTQVHTNIQAYHMCNSEDLRLFCNGYYAEILIMDPFSLEILFCLSSKMNPDWISALHVLRPSSRKDDVVLAISITGTVKVWSLLGHENKQSEPIYENESKQIRCLNALSLNCCAYNQRTVLIVCAKYCQIYDAGDFSVLCSIQAPSGERWMSGDFLAPDRVLVWSTEGKGYLYKLPANKLRGRAISSSVPDHKGFHGPTVDHDSPVLYGIMAHPDNKLLSCPPAMRFILTSVGGKQRRLLLRGDSAGVVLLWNVDDAALPVPNKVMSRAPIVTTSLDMAWADMNPSPVGVLDQFSHPEDNEIKLTASIYLLAANRLVVGREDGSIVIVNATHTVQLQLLHGNHQQLDDWPPHQLLLGHNGRVNCLLYPHHVHQRYDKSHLVSGGIDFAVCLWDLFSGALLHRFCVHAGEITQLIVPPQNCSPRIQKCICSVASDHSVTLLSLAERKCVTLASRHLFPVVTIKWRPADDFMVVGCSDGTVYVWQMETGHLDRVLHGMIAEEVLAACDEALADELGGSLSSGTDLQGLANPAVHFFRGLRHRNLTAMRAATQRGLAALHAAERGNGAGPLAEPPRARPPPLTVQGFRSNPADPESHILFFDIEGLIVELLSEEYSAMSPASLEAAGLITSEYMKVAALTQSASPDAAKRISDFFGRVKDKAGDMERLLKEKDKHGILAKMKEGAENMQTKLQAKAEQLKSHLDAKAIILLTDVAKAKPEDGHPLNIRVTSGSVEILDTPDDPELNNLHKIPLIYPLNGKDDKHRVGLRRKPYFSGSRYKRPAPTSPSYTEDDSVNWAIVKALMPKLKNLPWEWILSKIRIALERRMSAFVLATTQDIECKTRDEDDIKEVDIFLDTVDTSFDTKHAITNPARFARSRKKDRHKHNTNMNRQEKLVAVIINCVIATNHNDVDEEDVEIVISLKELLGPKDDSNNPDHGRALRNRRPGKIQARPYIPNEYQREKLRINLRNAWRTLRELYETLSF
ncbi:unnamed protein product [Colias eurytheme]|nr:unnamed protein product [Colias eurytheme]